VFKKNPDMHEVLCTTIAYSAGCAITLVHIPGKHLCLLPKPRQINMHPKDATKLSGTRRKPRVDHFVASLHQSCIKTQDL
jgi:hypothetical protein